LATRLDGRADLPRVFLIELEMRVAARHEIDQGLGIAAAVIRGPHYRGKIDTDLFKLGTEFFVGTRGGAADRQQQGPGQGSASKHGGAVSGEWESAWILCRPHISWPSSVGWGFPELTALGPCAWRFRARPRRPRRRRA